MAWSLPRVMPARGFPRGLRSSSSSLVAVRTRFAIGSCSSADEWCCCGGAASAGKTYADVEAIVDAILALVYGSSCVPAGAVELQPAFVRVLALGGGNSSGGGFSSLADSCSPALGLWTPAAPVSLVPALLYCCVCAVRVPAWRVESRAAALVRARLCLGCPHRPPHCATHGRRNREQSSTPCTPRLVLHRSSRVVC